MFRAYLRRRPILLNEGLDDARRGETAKPDRTRPADQPLSPPHRRETDGTDFPGARVAPAPAVLPRRRRRREPDAVGQAARDQGLPGDGAAPRGGARIPLHDQPGAQPAQSTRGLRRRGHRHAPVALATPRRRPVPGRRLRDPRLVLHGLPGHDDPAASPVPRALSAAIVLEQRGAAGPRPLPPARPARPASLVEPGVDPPDPLREGRRARRVPRQGTTLHRGRQDVASRQAAAAAWPGSSPCTASWPSAARSS